MNSSHGRPSVFLCGKGRNKRKEKLGIKPENPLFQPYSLSLLRKNLIPFFLLILFRFRLIFCPKGRFLGKNLNYRIEVRFEEEEGREGKQDMGLRGMERGGEAGKNLITKRQNPRVVSMPCEGFF